MGEGATNAFAFSPFFSDCRAWKRIRTHAASCREGEEKEIDNIAADNLSSILYQPTDWRFAQPSASDLRNASAERGACFTFPPEGNSLATSAR